VARTDQELQGEEVTPTAKVVRPKPHLLPRSALGISALVLFFALGAASSGAVLYAYYEYRQEANEDLMEQYAQDFDDRLTTAVATVEATRDESTEAVRSELGPLRQLAASGETVRTLIEKVSPSVWFVSTLAPDGSASVGSAFVVFSDPQESFLLASYRTVEAATRIPGPAVELSKGADRIGASVVSWDPEHDLALLSVPRAGLPRLNWKAESAPLGERLFGLTGLGVQGAAATQGTVVDVSAEGIQHDTPVGTHFQGGPLVTSDGEVVAIASLSYAPYNFASNSVYFAPGIRMSCLRVLRCPDGAPPTVR
jgi:S1-C subfamily serine protease